MASNSKLSREQKAMRKDMLQTLCKNAYIVQSIDKRVTMVYAERFRGSNMAHCAVSYASPDEVKPRRKVGEFYALERWYLHDTFQIPAAILPEDFVEYLSEHY